ncbi:hypothetical protein O0L34_g6215 [Tuta absoluta]|nr:hypothetical protein O0L34_g6215 [Tuta absoluta]
MGTKIQQQDNLPLIIRVVEMDQQQHRKITTLRQLEMLIVFLDKNRDLALGRLKSKEFRHKADRLWREVAELINPFGPERMGKEWAKVWNDQKCKVRAKLVAVNSAQRATGGGPYTDPNLSELESKIASIIGLDVGPLQDVMQNQIDPGDIGNDNVEEEEDNIVTEIVIQDDPEKNESIIIDYGDSYDEGQGPSQQETPPRASGNVNRARNVKRLERRRQASPLASASQTSRGAFERTQETPQASQTSRSALDRSREMVLRVEELRAQSDLNNSIAFKALADSMKLFAESADRLTRMFCSQQRGPE